MAFDAKARATSATGILQIRHAASMAQPPNKSKRGKNTPHDDRNAGRSVRIPQQNIGASYLMSFSTTRAL
jgi:hypothetical protein